MFIQLHTLTGFAGVLLNRDDTGMAKRLTYGNAVRTRTSSQFAKRKIRKAEGEFSLSDSALGVAVRSRETFKREIAKPLIEAGHDPQAVVDVTVIIMDKVYGQSDKAKKERKEKLALVAKGEAQLIDLLERSEINVLSRSEIDYLKSQVERFVSGADAKQAAKTAETELAGSDFKANLKAAGSKMSLDVAMFGRMITGDVLSTVDAAVHVAHAITTHGQSVETDFFTAVDDLVTGEDDHGGAHLGETEITSPMLYGYYVVDWKQLMINLAGVDNKEEVGAKMVSNLVHLVAEHVVGAKKGSTAPYSSADMILVETGNAQPRSLAEAFRKQVPPTLEAAVGAMAGYIEGKDRMYGLRVKRMVASSLPVPESFGEAMSVDAMAQASGIAAAGQA